MIKEIKDIIDRFENYLSAITFAEAGEFDTAQRIIRKKPALVVILSGTQEDEYLLNYAFNLAKRVNGAIKILCRESNLELKHFKEVDTDYELIECNKSSQNKLRDFVEKADFIVVSDEKAIEKFRISSIPIIFVEPKKSY